jgi:hypothetical protein
LPQQRPDEHLQALEIRITPDTLASMRDKFRMAGSVLRARAFDRRAA